MSLNSSNDQATRDVPSESLISQDWDVMLRKPLTVAMLIIGSAFMAILLACSVYYVITDNVLVEVVDKQFPAVFCVPISYVSALILVLILRVAAGPIEFKVLAVEFKGASGPLVFWVICFLALIYAFKQLWTWPA